MNSRFRMIKTGNQTVGAVSMIIQRRHLGCWVVIGLFFLVSCAEHTEYWTRPREKLPSEAVERAAVLGLRYAYRESAMWELKDTQVLSVQPMVPNKAFVQEHDPQEVYCVCVEFMARYHVPWTTKDRSKWEKMVRNILVIQTKGGHLLALRPSGVCPAFCK